MIPAPRNLFVLLAIYAWPMALIASAESPRVWQPYREAISTPAAVEIPPRHHLIPEPAPIDAVTDVELDQMAAVCCGDPVSSVGAPYDSALDFSTNQPMPFARNLSSDLELLPGDLLWHSYWAGVKEPRTSGVIFRDFSEELSLFDVGLGGRTSVLRKSFPSQGRPLGWELQLEGAAQLRLNLDQDFDVDSTDFRFGVPLIYAPNPYLHWKFAYYHLSSHAGDELLERDPTFNRINYSRDELVVAASFYPRPAWRWYAEAGWAFYEDEGAEPWEFQFGFDYAQPGPTGRQGTPFAAFNGHLRQEVDFGGNLVLQAGWLWRGRTGRVLRAGLHYYNGKSPQYEFFDTFEHHLGAGLWQEY